MPNPGLDYDDPEHRQRPSGHPRPRLPARKSRPLRALRPRPAARRARLVACGERVRQDHAAARPRGSREARGRHPRVESTGRGRARGSRVVTTFAALPRARQRAEGRPHRPRIAAPSRGPARTRRDRTRDARRASGLRAAHTTRRADPHAVAGATPPGGADAAPSVGPESDVDPRRTFRRARCRRSRTRRCVADRTRGTRRQRAVHEPRRARP